MVELVIRKVGDFEDAKVSIGIERREKCHFSRIAEARFLIIEVFDEELGVQREDALYVLRL
jgi:hypothetical protein